MQKIKEDKIPTVKEELTQEFKSTAVLPYINGISEVPCRWLHEQGVRSVFKSDTTLTSHLVRPIDGLDSNKHGSPSIRLLVNNIFLIFYVNDHLSYVHNYQYINISIYFKSVLIKKE